MFALKFLFKAIKLLNSETSANSIAAAFVLGTCMGLVPLLSLQFAFLALIVMFFRVNITSALFALGAWKILALSFPGALDSAGCALLEAESLRGVWTFATNAPVLSLLQLNNSIVLGATAASAVIAIPEFLIAGALIGFYRSSLQERIANSRIAVFLKGLKAYKLYRRLTSPLA